MTFPADGEKAIEIKHVKGMENTEFQLFNKTGQLLDPVS